MTRFASRLTAAIRKRTEQGGSALVPYVCAGYPDAESSLELLVGAAEAGADVVELGIPFSDPLADGPTIQRAGYEALRGGMTVRGSLALVEAFRKRSDVPVVVFTYLNPVHRFGMEAFVRAAADAGASGLLLTDLPAGADPALEVEAAAGGLDLIRLVAPTTPPERLAEAVRGGGGFVYYISRTGVTGAREDLRRELGEEIGSLRARLELPVVVGFGISTPEQAALAARAADGVVVGSALLDVVGSRGVEGGLAFLRSLRRAIDAERAAAPS